jgi:DedD protein
VNDILKQRLVGALILLALGVVFWPIIFVEPGDKGPEERASIPPRPAVDTTPVEAPDMAGLPVAAETRAERERDAGASAAGAAPARAELPAETGSVAPVERAEPEPVAAVEAAPARRTRTEPPEKPVIDSDGLPVAWILQVASVSSADKAEELRQRLVAMEHKAYVKRIRSGDKSLYRVYVGPKLERAGLEQIQAEIDAEFGVQSMIARYVP